MHEISVSWNVFFYPLCRRISSWEHFIYTVPVLILDFFNQCRDESVSGVLFEQSFVSDGCWASLSSFLLRTNEHAVWKNLLTQLKTLALFPGRVRDNWPSWTVNTLYKAVTYYNKVSVESCSVLKFCIAGFSLFSFFVTPSCIHHNLFPVSRKKKDEWVVK